MWSQQSAQKKKYTNKDIGKKIKKEQKGLIQTCGKQVKEILYMLCLCLLLFETCIFWKTGEKTEGDIHCR